MNWNGFCIRVEICRKALTYPVPTQFKTDRTGIGIRTMQKLSKRKNISHPNNLTKMAMIEQKSNLTKVL